MENERKKPGRPKKVVMDRVVKKNVSFSPGNHKYIIKILEERKMDVKGHFSKIVNEIIADHLKVSRYKEIEATKLKEQLGHLE